MPELPEVETIARSLRRTIVGRQVRAVELSGLPLRRPIDADFAPSLVGRTIAAVRRRGKYLVVELQPRAFWLIHLGMSGRVVFCTAAEAPQPHTHAIVRFADGSELQYRDHRRFGLLAAYRADRPGSIPELQRLGLDPTSRRFTGSWLLPMLAASRQEVKSFLLDQRRIAGLGNIYVCEALFRAGVHPARRCFTLRAEEAERLARAIRRVILRAIRFRGTTFSDFYDSDGDAGGNQRFLGVFQREGSRCRRCAGRIERIVQGNRSSFFCPRCQPRSRRAVRSENRLIQEESVR